METEDLAGGGQEALETQETMERNVAPLGGRLGHPIFQSMEKTWLFMLPTWERGRDGEEAEAAGP